ncbi:MAG: sulfurtransferase-like selenium metabolism protein YedF [Syntrophomonas sp.]|uniref:sulfurtransferase-like selenium metabolism protein YedF n=1 Tax=Syntrophomonas sp. TaxID=2053627 RepID=UPI0026166583|nr:sulfurtransferase-like selenium metabolism protein YedF [Syntrophomonas sp.]MDD2509796.1 sulfurtransferase-like selenium metabolism protein YedF [Syntrophomonas sp.]MDD4625644.1 sulfurtransferase-like selenium metabolism protein YedF [Syntrophomonas sp.]
MKKTVDARGLTCPQPVVLTKNALEEEEISEVITIVDNKTAFENVSRLAQTLKMECKVDEKEGSYYIDILKSETSENLSLVENSSADTVVLICGNVLGRGDDKLGALLMKNFIYTLSQVEGTLKSLIFMNGGVLLSTEGSEALEQIRLLEESGVEVLSCGTCLDSFQLSDKLRVGIATNMYSIVERLSGAAKVIML